MIGITGILNLNKLTHPCNSIFREHFMVNIFLYFLIDT